MEAKFHLDEMDMVNWFVDECDLPPNEADDITKKLLKQFKVEKFPDKVRDAE